MGNSEGKITRKEAKEALLRSGYLLECRVEGYLREHWGYVEANATYEDPDTGKSREYDVYAMKAYPAGQNDRDYLFGVLLIECINNPQPLAVMTKEPLIGFLHHEEVKLAGLPVKVPAAQAAKGWQRLSEYLVMKNYHHYCKGRFGTQFCSFAKKKTGRKEEWMAIHEGYHFDSIRKLCDVVEYRVDHHFNSWVLRGKEHVNIEVYVPVIILQGELLDARQTTRSVTLRPVDHIQFRRSVTKSGKEIDYQIDIIRERFLPQYINIIDKELDRTANLLRRRYKTVSRAIEAIMEKAEKHDSKEKLREVFDF